MSRLALAIALAAVATPRVDAQPPLPPDVLAERLVEAGRKALLANDRAVAKSRFESVIEKFGNTPAANAARFGLATVVGSGAEADPAKAAGLLQGPMSDGNFADRARAAHLAGVCQLRLAVGEKSPRDRLERARQAFRAARDAARDKRDAELVALASCDLADAELRLDQVQEARAGTEPFVKDAELRKTAAGKRGLYLHGLSLFRLKDYAAAGRALARASPLADPSLESHAQYLLGRVAHLGGEPAEAGVHYEASLAEHERARRAAQKRLKSGERRDRFETARLEALGRQVPDWVAAAGYQSATLAAEAGQYADALVRFEQFARDTPDSPLTPDARLRAGICLAQLGRADEAIQRLLPLVEFARTADQAYLWLGKAQLRRARAGNKEAVKLALECLGHAVDRADSAGDAPDARVRQHEARLELADARHLAGDARQAAEIYERLWGEQAFPARREELLARLADAWGRAGETDRSRGRVEEFAKAYPDSPFLGAVNLRGAENALAAAARAESERQSRDQLNRLYDEAAAKFAEVADKGPDSPRAAEARYGQAAALARAGQHDAAIKALRRIPARERVGELAAANELLGDCLIRATPAGLVGDVARANLTAAAEALSAFVAAEPRAKGLPAALLKLGHAHRRLGESSAAGATRDRSLDAARAALERLTRDFGHSEPADLGRVELAGVRAARGDRGGAANELQPFAQNGARRDSPAAPLAALDLAALLRFDNRPAEAVKVLADARQRHEGALLADPERAGVATLLKFHQALAQSETDKPAEAIPLFEQVVSAARAEPIAAEATLRGGRIRLVEAQAKLATARQARERAGNDQKRKAEEAVARAREPVRQAAEALGRAGDGCRDAQPLAEARARLYYESAWAYRTLADSARAGGADLKSARANYQKLVDQLPDSASAGEARLELADLLAGEGDRAKAIEILKDAVATASGESAGRAGLKLGSLLMQAGDVKGAAAQFDKLAEDAKSPLLAQALARGGEAHLAAGDPAKAIERLTPFRDKPEFRDRENFSARSLLRLGQAHLKLKQFEPAGKTFDALLERFGRDALAADARFGLGEVLQAKGDHDGAIRAFEQVRDATAREVAAQAQIRIGLSRVAQKKYADAAVGLLAVGYEFAQYPEAGQLARLEAARALALDGKTGLAREVLTKLAEELPESSELGAAARVRLAGLAKPK